MEQNKVLMVIVSVAIFFTAIIGVGVALLYPRSDVETGDEIAGSIEEFDPIEYIRRPDTAPIVGSDTEEPEIIVYGTETPSDESLETPLTERDTAIGEITVTRDTEQAISNDRIVEAPARVATVPPAPERVPEPRQTRVTEYWIQLIASPSRDRVEQAQITLADVSLGGRITTREVGGTVFYRLRVGPYPSADEAEKFLEWITDIEGFEGAYVSEEYPLRTVNG